MSADHYGASAQRWALGASLVYGPIAAELVAMCPHHLAGRRVLDAGAGTGVACSALAAAGASCIAMDLSFDMLAWNSSSRPPCAVADICSLPLGDASMDDVVAGFVLNHLADPGPGFSELVRVTRPGGALLTAVFSATFKSAARDRIDEVAVAAGYRAPDWYLEMKAVAVPRLGSDAAMTLAAKAAGLVDPLISERPVDVGVTRPDQLVDYRLGQAHFAAWLDEIGPARTEDVRARARDAVRPITEPYQPVVVFLAATV